MIKGKTFQKFSKFPRKLIAQTCVKSAINIPWYLHKLNWSWSNIQVIFPKLINWCARWKMLRKLLAWFASFCLEEQHFFRRSLSEFLLKGTSQISCFPACKRRWIRDNWGWNVCARCEQLISFSSPSHSFSWDPIDPLLNLTLTHLPHTPQVLNHQQTAVSGASTWNSNFSYYTKSFKGKKQTAYSHVDNNFSMSWLHLKLNL